MTTPRFRDRRDMHRRPLPPRLLPPSRPATRTFMAGFGLWFAFCAILGLGMLGVIVWAVIELVTWVVSK